VVNGRRVGVKLRSSREFSGLACVTRDTHVLLPSRQICHVLSGWYQTTHRKKCNTAVSNKVIVSRNMVSVRHSHYSLNLSYVVGSVMAIILNYEVAALVAALRNRHRRVS
jgi:hypothetical protein